MYAEEIIIPYLAMRLGRPVKWVEERWENMLAFHGRGHTVDVEAAVQRDGTLLGLRVQIVADLGPFSSPHPRCPSSPAIASPGPHPGHAWRYGGSSPINRPPGRTGRLGAQSRLLPRRTIDLIARDLAGSRAWRNFIPPDAFPYETPTGLTYDSGQYELTLDRALALSDYHHWRAQSRQPGVPGAPRRRRPTVVKGSGGRAAPDGLRAGHH